MKAAVGAVHGHRNIRKSKINATFDSGYCWLFDLILIICYKMKPLKSLAALSCAALCMVACTKTQAPELGGVTVDSSEITLEKGETRKLSFSVTPEGAEWQGVYWQSSDESVVTVDQDGIVTAVAVGTAEVSVHVDSFKDVCIVTVKGGALESFDLNETSLSLFVGGTSLLSFTYNPADADFDPKDAVWSSDNESVATVDQTGLVTAVSEGEAVITLAAGDVTADCSVSVMSEAKAGDFFYSDGTWSAELDPDKTCIGVVFYAGHHENDLSDYSSTGIGSVKCHGYVVALHDASPADCIHWGPNDVLLENYPLDEDGEPVVISNFTNNVEDADWNGYLWTSGIRAAAEAAGGLSEDVEGYPAAWYAVNYSADAAPESTSGWFLPSISQVNAAVKAKDKIGEAGGDAFLDAIDGRYVSSSEDAGYEPAGHVLYYCTYSTMANFPLQSGEKFADGYDPQYRVRSVLAF